MYESIVAFVFPDILIISSKQSIYLLLSKEYENVPILVLTNQSQVTDIDAAKNLGVKSYIVKATTIPSEIVDEVKKLFDIK